MQYEWYADIFFLINFLMDTAAVFAAAVICSHRTRPAFAFLSGAFGAGCSTAAFCFLHRYILICALIHGVVNPLMTILAFRPGSIRRFVRLHVHIYIILLLAGGLQECLVLYTGAGDPLRILLSGIACIAFFTIWMTRRNTMQYVCTVDLWYQQRKIQLCAYLDSGNLLYDPVTHSAVSVVKEAALPSVWLRQAGICREIPYETLDHSTSHIKICVLDQMEWEVNGVRKKVMHPVIALKGGQLMGLPGVDMILHSTYMTRE